MRDNARYLTSSFDAYPPGQGRPPGRVGQRIATKAQGDEVCIIDRRSAFHRPDRARLSCPASG